MELGEKLRQARLEAGISQRALCDGEITRNMLSLIENGSAHPSMKTLQFLAARLGKPVSFFLEEEGSLSPNQAVMEAARGLYDSGLFRQAAQALEAYRSPDVLFDREKQLLWELIRLGQAEQAIEDGREPYARELLERAAVEGVYCAAALEQRRQLLLAQVDAKAPLPSLDRELLLYAQRSLGQGDPLRASHLLDAMECRDTPHWMLLRGQVYLAAGDYQNAAQCLTQAETAFPDETIPQLEVCYRELGDFKQAYLYACRQKR